WGGAPGPGPGLPHFSRPKQARPRLAERFYARCFVVLHIEDGVELGDLQQVVNFLGEVEQLEFAALVLGSGEGADQLADTGAVDIVHVAEVQQDLFLPLGKQVAHGIAQNHAAFAEGDPAAEVDYGNAIHLTSTGLHAHWGASLESAGLPWTCLIILSSVPVWEGWISTTSMNERIRKMPRPDVFIRLSGANGSGILLTSSPLPCSRITLTRSRGVRSNASVTFLPGS